MTDFCWQFESLSTLADFFPLLDNGQRPFLCRSLAETLKGVARVAKWLKVVKAMRPFTSCLSSSCEKFHLVFKIRISKEIGYLKNKFIIFYFMMKFDKFFEILTGLSKLFKL